MELKEFVRERRKKLPSDLILAVFFGIILIAVGNLMFDSSPKKEKAEETTAFNEIGNKDNYISELESKTENIFSHINGAGKVDVMLTLNSGRESVYAEENKKSVTKNDESGMSENEENKIVMRNNNDGSTEPVLIKELTAEISGVVIVSEGGDDILVKNSLIRAAQALFGVSANKVEVFKMKQEA